MACNAVQVGKFYDVLENVLLEPDFINSPGSLYNQDESGFTLVQEPPKVVTTKGKSVSVAVICLCFI